MNTVSAAGWFPINAAELGRRLAELGPEALLRLVNGLLTVWSAHHGAGLALRLNELPNLPDGGIDAFVELPRAVGDLPAGRIVFQIKWRDVRRNAEKELWRRLGRHIDDEIRRLLERQPRPPDAYVLVTNLRLGETEQRTFVESRERLHEHLPRGWFHLWEASRLFAELRAHPHLGFWLFRPTSALSLPQAEEAMRRRATRLGLPYPESFAGRQEQLRLVREAVVRREPAPLVLHGPPGIGSSRLLLEALRGLEGRVVWFAGELPTAEELDLLLHSTVIVAVDQPPDLGALERILARPLTAAVIAAVSGEPIPPSLRRFVLEIPPLTSQEVDRLLASLCDPATRQPSRLGPLQRAWVVRNAAGLPGLAVLLAISALCCERWDRAEATRDWLETLLSRLSETERRTLEFVAALGPIGARGIGARELFGAMEALGASVDDLAAHIDRLEGRGLIALRGHVAEVPVGLVASRLAERWLDEHRSRIVGVVLGLEDGWRRLVRLVARASGSELARDLAEDALRSWFPEPRDLAERPREFRLLAAATPEVGLHHLQRLLEADRGAILEPLAEEPDEPQVDRSADPRLDHLREIGELLEDLIFRGIDVPRAAIRLEALRLLARLAAASPARHPSETFVELFAEAMVPGHPEVDIPLDQRRALLQRLASSSEEAERRLAAEALRTIYQATGRFSFRYRSGSSRRPSAWVPVTLEELKTHYRVLANLAARLVGDDALPLPLRGELARGAILLHGSPAHADENAVKRIVRAADRAFPVKPDTVTERKRIVSALELSLHSAPQPLHEVLEEQRRELEPRSGASFRERLLWLASELTRDQETMANEAGTAAPDTVVEELQRMASRAARKPDLLDRGLVLWVLEEAPLGHLFAARMGQEEARRGEGPALIRELETEPETTRGWVWYLASWARATGDRERIEELVRQIVARGALSLAAKVVFTTEPDGEGAWRALWSPIGEGLAAAGPRGAEAVTRALQSSTWARQLAARELVKLLRELLEAGAAPLEVVKVTWARRLDLEDPLVELVMDAMERWTEVTDDPRRLDDLLSLDDPLRAAASRFPERYISWLLNAVRRVVEQEGFVAPGSIPVVRRLLDHLGERDRTCREQLLLLVARILRRLPAAVGPVPIPGEALLDPLEPADRKLLTRIAREDPEAAGVILDAVLGPADPITAAAVARAEGRASEEAATERTEAYLELLVEAGRASGWHPTVREAVERSLERLQLSSWTETLAQRALEKLKEWERSEDPELRRWASSLRPQYEERLERGAQWDQGTLFWDSRLSADDARHILDRDPQDGQRRWLVRRILSDVPFHEAQLLLSAEDVARALEETDELSPKRRRMWEVWLREKARVP